ncbi:FecR family protein [Acinetobacter larvae]|uniref:FecR protein domain-containing protein n=1 Tax=Acinetobacter larvae TaxID=1789224 RepID=A0A1B2LXU0_9GAMM|nr:FecR domain-containing protein [Acinetobacter larvae]AOA57745.1 hypothetical protein BFG52_04825 [Acinetobacter larvae]
MALQQDFDATEKQQIMQQAALWLVKMSSDDRTDADQEAFEQWLQQNPKHLKQLQALEKTLGNFYQLKQQNTPQAISNTLEQSFLWNGRSALLILFSTLMILAMSWKVLPTQQWFADTKTTYDQWQEQLLSDHSEIKISGTTAYDIRFNQQQRLIDLYRGNILVDVAKDAQRPFIVKTKNAKITALGTRFIIHHYDDVTILTMLESKTKVELLGENRDKHPAITVAAGQQLILNKQGVIAQTNVPTTLFEEAWQQHMLVVQDMPLSHVLGILKTYSSMGITFEAESLQDVKVSATLPLNDDGIDLLSKSFNLKVEKSLWGKWKITK